ncbi:MAG TPA: serine/threonine protein kinase [Pirellulales bacterium]|nr:serine/threonine protein kinase [Pirellulales bacterium]
MSSFDRTLAQSDEDLRRARERSLQPTRPPLQVPGYRAERFLGAGAYGQVWVAVDTNTGRRVAIKFYLHRGGLDWNILTREVERLALLFADRYVVQLIEVGWDSDPPYFVMEYLDHGSLADRLNAGPVSAQEAVELFRDVAVGLVHAHGKGILHCDLKPANVLLDQDGLPRLADFGQSRLSHEQTPSLGTLFYMAPEQADLHAVPDARWDVYALGALLYAMLTGDPPYRSEQAVAEMQQAGNLEAQLARYRRAIEQAPRPKAHRRVPGVDRALSDIIHRCLAVDAHKRYPNPQAVLDALHLRNTRRARRPLLVLGLIGPMILLGIASFFGYNVFETSLSDSRAALTYRVLESDRFAAQFVAETVAREIDERWRTLEHVAADQDFRRAFFSAVGARGDASARRDLQALLEKLDREIALGDSGSWYVLDSEGTQLARSPQAAETIGGNYAYRDYFHGQGEDLQRGVRPRPLTRPHLSIVFTSEATNKRTVALSAPIFDDAGNDPIGVLCHSVELGHFAELRADERSGNDQIPVLVDSREDERGRRGAVLEHPGLRSMLKKGPEAADRLYLPADTLSDLQRLRHLRSNPHPENNVETTQTNELATLDDYRDPLAGEFAGRWLAAAEPVEVIARQDLSSRDTGWVILVQERYDAAVAPVQRLRDQLLWRAKLATTFFAIVLAGLWGFVVLVLNESPRLRWLSRLRHRTDGKPHAHTPDSSGFGSSELSASSATAATPPTDTLPRGGVKSAETPQAEGESARPPGG